MITDRKDLTDTESADSTGDRAASAAAPFEVGMFESSGIRLYYEIHGQGPRVLVFMHGILLDANMNRRLAQDLAARGNRVILLDLPGHGLSEKPRRASSHRMDSYARHVVALLDHLGIDKAVIGGVSLGGNVSLLVAAQALPIGSHVLVDIQLARAGESLRALAMVLRSEEGASSDGAGGSCRMGLKLIALQKQGLQRMQELILKRARERQGPGPQRG